MAECFIGEIRITPYNFAPKNWAFCNGQTLSIAQNTALFSIIGTLYGGNGTTTFALPNLQGRVPVQQGQGPGLSNYSVGQQVGAETTTLLAGNLPSHTHPMNGTTAAANTTSPAGLSRPGIAPGGRGEQGPAMYTPYSAAQTVALNPTTLAFTGGAIPVSLQQPYLMLNFIIALAGIYPSRT